MSAYINKVLQQLTETPLKSMQVRNCNEFVFANKYRTASISIQYINPQLKLLCEEAENKGTHIKYPFSSQTIW